MLPKASESSWELLYILRSTFRRSSKLITFSFSSSPFLLATFSGEMMFFLYDRTGGQPTICALNISCNHSCLIKSKIQNTCIHIINLLDRLKNRRPLDSKKHRNFQLVQFSSFFRLDNIFSFVQVGSEYPSYAQNIFRHGFSFYDIAKFRVVKK